MKITSVTNPQWANQFNTCVNCLITTEQFGDELLPFTASPDDVEPYGRQLFQELVAGVYGPISAYQPPAPPSAEANKQNAEQRLQSTDWVNEPDVYDPARNPHLMNRNEFLDYRSWCRNIAVYPVAGNLDWPIVPVAIWSN